MNPLKNKKQKQKIRGDLKFYTLNKCHCNDIYAAVKVTCKHHFQSC